MSMSSTPQQEEGLAAQMISFMYEQFAVCCSPRAKLGDQIEARPVERNAITEFFPGAEPAKPKASGSDTESAHSGSDTDSEAQAHATSARVPRVPSSRRVEESHASAELNYLAALLMSNKADPDATLALCVYAQSFGASACVKLLTTELMGDGRPLARSLLPDAFAAVQELMGRLTLDAMQRESSDELSVLVALTHRIIKAPIDECEECEPDWQLSECQGCECEEEEEEKAEEKEEVEQEDPWLTCKTTAGHATGRAPAIKTDAARSWIGQWTAGASASTSPKAVRFDVDREQPMPE